MSDIKGFRISQELIKQVDDVILKYPELYSHRTHFVKAAIIRELRRINEVI